MTKIIKTSPKQKGPAPQKIIDVAKPGDTAANPTSKSVLISNHPVMQDPMVNAPEVKADTTTIPGAPLLAPAKRLVIKPLHDTTSAPVESSSPLSIDIVTKQASVEAASSDVSAPLVTVESSNSTNDTEELEAPAEDPIAESKPIASKPTISDITATPASLEHKTIQDDPQLDADQIQAIAEAEAAEHTGAIKKLVDSEQYFLPINHLEKRRTKRFIMLGVVVIVVLSAAWADVALDAGLISNSYHLPHTHLFANK